MIQNLVLEFPDDPKVYAIEDQYLFGRNLVAAPDLTEEDERRIYIPEGGWHDFWTGERLRGPRWIRYPCPLERVPLFAREGTLLPLGPVMQYVGKTTSPRAWH
ncbi:MAG: glycoside hydrolase family 31 protein [Actinomycetota bacterium]|nr:glycoside hydrolase family 31 protein [Actinomycetota bacterium]